MEKYAEMLRELGIEIDVTPPDLLITKTENELEYDWYCEQDVSCPMYNGFGLEYSDEQNMDWIKKHRYDRRGRFKVTLYSLLNIRGHVPLPLMIEIRRELRTMKPKMSKSKIWNSIRRILKRNNNQRYYNCIPIIINFCSGLSPDIEEGIIPKILENFHLMHYQFDQMAGDLNRCYFPNLRFIALKLIEHHGITYPYNAPKIRTARKLHYLNDMFDLFKIN